MTKPARLSKYLDNKFSFNSSLEEFKKVQKILIDQENFRQRLDNFLLFFCKGVPKSHIYQIIRSGQVRVNSGRVSQTYKLKIGDIVRIPAVKISKKEIIYIPKISLKILFEDDNLLIINKPHGLAVHGGSGINYGVIEQVRFHFKNKFFELVHRLDRDTSGILMIAKKRSALTNLQKQIRDGLIEKRYLTLAYGNWVNNRQHIKFPLYKFINSDGERRVRVDPNGLYSHSVFNLVKKYGDFSLIDAEIKTGRTHQIRVHLSELGFPILGDQKYGNFVINKKYSSLKFEKKSFKRMFLHAYKLSFKHPESNKKIIIESSLPEECKNFLKTF
tara:strand:+ start:966 stop:1955 length:990 start_codon:yes stop_codon:yes gene_type:complete